MCYSSTHIYGLWGARFLQSLGAAVGVVLGQTIFTTPLKASGMHKFFRQLAPLALAPALGALSGFSWWMRPLASNFLTFDDMGRYTDLLLFIFPKHFHGTSALGRNYTLFKRMIVNPKSTCSLVVGIANGILYSYNAEGAFYDRNLRLNSYCLRSWFTAFAAVRISWKLSLTLSTQHSLHLLFCKRQLSFVGAFFSSYWALFWDIVFFEPPILIALTFACMLIVCFGRGLTITNCLALGLQDFRTHAGSAASIFVFSYYFIVALLTTHRVCAQRDTTPHAFFFSF